MFSNQLPRHIAMVKKREIFFRLAGPFIIISSIYLIILGCYIAFGRKDDFILTFAALGVIGLLTISISMYYIFDAIRNISLAENGQLIQAQITHIKPLNSMIYQLEYTYQINASEFKKNFEFHEHEISLFSTENPIDIFCNINNPKISCTVRSLFPEKYDTITTQSKWWILSLIAFLNIAVGIIEYYRLSIAEQNNSAFIKLFSFERLPYSLFGKTGVTILFLCLGIFLLIYSLIILYNVYKKKH